MAVTKFMATAFMIPNPTPRCVMSGFFNEQQLCIQHQFLHQVLI